MIRKWLRKWLEVESVDAVYEALAGLQSRFIECHNTLWKHEKRMEFLEELIRRCENQCKK